MKRKFLSAVVSLIIISALSFLAFAEPGFAYSENDLIEFTPKWESIIADDSVISVTPGAEQGELRFAWLSAEGESTPLFIISANADMSSSRECEVIVNKAIEEFNSNNVTVKGLEEGKTYYYSYTKNGEWSSPTPVTVQPDEKFTVLFVSDAQIGRSGDEKLEEVLIRDTCGWNYTVNKMLTQQPNAAFAISAGDQFQSEDSLVQMKAYLSPVQLRSLPVANTIGNHDNDASLYGDIFNNPNEVKETFAAEAGTGYYYTYGDALFITLNSNNTFPSDAAKVLREAVNAYPDTKWRVVTMHHNPYSVTDDDSDFSKERFIFSPLFDCYDIDLCLSGHDHIYSRTAATYGGKIATGEGTVYIQSTSASGSNYDNLNDSKLSSFTVSVFDTNIPTYTAFTFTDEAIIGTTYRTDSDEIVDSFEIADNTSDSSAGFFNVLFMMFKTLFSML